VAQELIEHRNMELQRLKDRPSQALLQCLSQLRMPCLGEAYQRRHGLPQ
jgi:hypothetical protein